jgi:manganese transport system ATP-binding protein
LAYERGVVLSRVTLSVPPGSLTALLGPPGSGKSTLLRAIVGRLAPRSGELRVFGGAPLAARARVGYAPPVEGADWRFPISVGEAAMLGRFTGLGLARRPDAADRAAVERSLALVGLQALVNRPVGGLGSGQRRRLMLARALTRQPGLLLLDGTLDGLEQSAERELALLLDRLRAEGTTVILATRELRELGRRFDWLVLLGGPEALAGPPARIATRHHLGAAFGPRRVWSLEPVERFALDGAGEAD